MKDYESGWVGTWESSDVFNFKISVKKISASKFEFEIRNKNASAKKTSKFSEDNNISFSLDSNFSFKGYLDGNKIEGFIKTGMNLRHITLTETNGNTYKGNFNLFMVSDLSRDFFLSLENGAREKYEAYSVFGDNRIQRVFNYDFKKLNDEIFFKDLNSGLRYEGKLKDPKIFFDIKLFSVVVTKIDVTRINDKWTPTNNYELTIADGKDPQELHDGWRISGINKEGLNKTLLSNLIDSINNGNLINTHSVLIARNGKLIFEKYFAGFNASIPHDTRSASKSISSAITGLAIARGYIKDANEKMYDLLPEKYRYAEKTDVRKSKIRLKDLLTMSSGIDAVDFGTERQSIASENNFQNSDDWAATVVNAPMINEPGTHSFYGTANPFILGIAIGNQVKEPLELFIDKNLFAPLGITNYSIFLDPEGRPYFGGGMYLTPRDLLKFGQMYLDKGKWNDKEVIPEEWVNESFKKYLVLENTSEKNEYGYYWWHYNYKIGDKNVESIEARGAGGQYIFIIPEYNLTAVVTSGNYRNNKGIQPEKIMQEYILPAILK